ncbi:hypothetical protein K7G98_33045, partial [Saccharothrix sp. MB29]|nr:hypothetical protein [Saccharothrix sp. MB29]
TGTDPLKVATTAASVQPTTRSAPVQWRILVRRTTALAIAATTIGALLFTAVMNADGAHHVWVDHNDISGASDGALDVKRGSDYVTVSWNRFHDQTKNSLVGHSDGNGSQDRGKLRITYHHNLFDGTAERNPRVRFADPVHVFNNYYRNIRGTDSYGAATAMDAGVLDVPTCAPPCRCTV